MANTLVGSAEAAFSTTSTTILDAYNVRNNMFDAKQKFSLLVKELKTSAVLSRLSMAQISLIRTIEAFEQDHTRSYQMFLLAMSMSPMSFRSVLSGTVAWDATRTRRRDWYDASGLGIYAVGVSVNSRQGKFLSGLEIQQLSNCIDNYVAGYRALSVSTYSRTMKQDADVRFMHIVDSAISLFNSAGACRSIDNNNDLDRVVLLAQRFRGRAQKIMTVDPTGQVIQVQSPLYIGRSDKMENGTEVYTKLNLTNMNKLLALALNVLHTMGLKSSAIVRPVLCIWEVQQLPIAERFVATIAQSMVAQNGFNATEAGGEPSTASLGELTSAKNQIFGTKLFLKQHLTTGQAEVDARMKFLADLADISDCFEKLDAQQSAILK